eukprot:TRINITY_DN12758_c0_g1_i1.p1 TRINITY_DN12758_c0_g1~~TRINITY_DN12758_c0_g1_i1.p1  ORF type:complete len:1514 (+),score=197.37 TRINITY_DN12758_c0_g1_i1:26-4543(+)
MLTGEVDCWEDLVGDKSSEEGSAPSSPRTTESKSNLPNDLMTHPSASSVIVAVLVKKEQLSFTKATLVRQVIAWQGYMRHFVVPYDEENADLAFVLFENTENAIAAQRKLQRLLDPPSRCVSGSAWRSSMIINLRMNLKLRTRNSKMLIDNALGENTRLVRNRSSGLPSSVTCTAAPIRALLAIHSLSEMAEKLPLTAVSISPSDPELALSIPWAAELPTGISPSNCTGNILNPEDLPWPLTITVPPALRPSKVSLHLRQAKALQLKQAESLIKVLTVKPADTTASLKSKLRALAILGDEPGLLGCVDQIPPGGGSRSSFEVYSTAIKALLSVGHEAKARLLMANAKPRPAGRAADLALLMSSFDQPLPVPERIDENDISFRVIVWLTRSLGIPCKAFDVNEDFVNLQREGSLFHPPAVLAAVLAHYGVTDEGLVEAVLQVPMFTIGVADMLMRKCCGIPSRSKELAATIWERVRWLRLTPTRNTHRYFLEALCVAPSESSESLALGLEHWRTFVRHPSPRLFVSLLHLFARACDCRIFAVYETIRNLLCAASSETNGRFRKAILANLSQLLRPVIQACYSWKLDQLAADYTQHCLQLGAFPALDTVDSLLALAALSRAAPLLRCASQALTTNPRLRARDPVWVRLHRTWQEFVPKYFTENDALRRVALGPATVSSPATTWGSVAQSDTSELSWEEDVTYDTLGDEDGPGGRSIDPHEESPMYLGPVNAHWGKAGAAEPPTTDSGNTSPVFQCSHHGSGGWVSNFASLSGIPSSAAPNNPKEREREVVEPVKSPLAGAMAPGKKRLASSRQEIATEEYSKDATLHVSCGRQTTEQELRECYAHLDGFISLELVRNARGQSCGFAFVHFGSHDCAHRAMQLTHGRKVGSGWWLAARWFRPELLHHRETAASYGKGTGGHLGANNSNDSEDTDTRHERRSTDFDDYSAPSTPLSPFSPLTPNGGTGTAPATSHTRAAGHEPPLRRPAAETALTPVVAAIASALVSVATFSAMATAQHSKSLRKQAPPQPPAADSNQAQMQPPAPAPLVDTELPKEDELPQVQPADLLSPDAPEEERTTAVAPSEAEETEVEPEPLEPVSADLPPWGVPPRLALDAFPNPPDTTVDGTTDWTEDPTLPERQAVSSIEHTWPRGFKFAIDRPAQARSQHDQLIARVFESQLGGDSSQSEESSGDEDLLAALLPRSQAGEIAPELEIPGSVSPGLTAFRSAATEEDATAPTPVSLPVSVWAVCPARSSDIPPKAKGLSSVTAVPTAPDTEIPADELATLVTMLQHENDLKDWQVKSLQEERDSLLRRCSNAEREARIARANASCMVRQVNQSKQTIHKLLHKLVCKPSLPTTPSILPSASELHLQYRVIGLQAELQATQERVSELEGLLGLDQQYNDLAVLAEMERKWPCVEKKLRSYEIALLVHQEATRRAELERLRYYNICLKLKQFHAMERTVVYPDGSLVPPTQPVPAVYSWHTAAEAPRAAPKEGVPPRRRYRPL